MNQPTHDRPSFTPRTAIIVGPGGTAACPDCGEVYTQLETNVRYDYMADGATTSLASSKGVDVHHCSAVES